MSINNASVLDLGFLKQLGILEKNYGSSTGQEWNESTSEKELKIYSPANGNLIASVYQASEQDYEIVMKKAETAFDFWKMIPAPKRGDIVRQIGLKLREFERSAGD